MLPSLPWILKIVVPYVLSFVVRQIAKWGEAIDWALVKADAEERVRALLPDWLFEDDVVEAVHLLLDICAEALGKSNALKAILEKCVAKDFAGALELARQLLVGIVKPGTQEAQVAHAAFFDTEDGIEAEEGAPEQPAVAKPKVSGPAFQALKNNLVGSGV